jgi:hypothetical protein
VPFEPNASGALPASDFALEQTEPAVLEHEHSGEAIDNSRDRFSSALNNGYFASKSCNSCAKRERRKLRNGGGADRVVKVNAMLCEMCQQREALVHLTTTIYKAVAGQEAGTRKQHLCQQCADTYFACTPGMNPCRGLICLSDDYRSRLYDLLEKANPEAFDSHDVEACRRGSRIVYDFLREQLKKENIGVNEDAFGMLCHDFFGRMDECRRKKG